MIENNVIRVAELFAGVGGFRIGFSQASDVYDVVFSNQWEPATKCQDASEIYTREFGNEGHSNVDISTIYPSDIPQFDLLCGGFPCQDYSVASTLKNSGGIEGKKGVLWWEIHRILNSIKHKPEFLFFENVDRLLKSPAKQKGRDFAIILASLSDLGYTVEWRVINAADYGMPQRRRRTYILGYLNDSTLQKRIFDCSRWILKDGVIAKAFPITCESQYTKFILEGSLSNISDKFGKNMTKSLFENTGIMKDRVVYTLKTTPLYNGVHATLGDILVDENDVPESFYIEKDDIPKWEYAKGAKKFKRKGTDGFEYNYNEGAMPFPDGLDKPSRTIITSEGGKTPSRFKHVIRTKDGRYRRLVPIELERLNMFPDNHTQGYSDNKRAFFMGNALVCGVIERIGRSLVELLKL